MINIDGWSEAQVQLYQELEAIGLMKDGKLTQSGRDLLDVHYGWMNGKRVPKGEPSTEPVPADWWAYKPPQEGK